MIGVLHTWGRQLPCGRLRALSGVETAAPSPYPLYYTRRGFADRRQKVATRSRGKLAAAQRRRDRGVSPRLRGITPGRRTRPARSDWGGRVAGRLVGASRAGGLRPERRALPRALRRPHRHQRRPHRHSHGRPCRGDVSLHRFGDPGEEGSHPRRRRVHAALSSACAATRTAVSTALKALSLSIGTASAISAGFIRQLRPGACSSRPCSPWSLWFALNHWRCRSGSCVVRTATPSRWFASAASRVLRPFVRDDRLLMPLLDSLPLRSRLPVERSLLTPQAGQPKRPLVPSRSPSTEQFLTIRHPDTHPTDRFTCPFRRVESSVVQIESA